MDPVNHEELRAHETAAGGGLPRDPGLRGAWGALSAELRRFVAARVAAVDVDDVVQEVLAAAALHELRRGEPQRLSALVLTIARRTVAEHHRRRAREHHRVARAALEPDDPGGEPLGPAERSLASVIALFLEGINPVYADAVRAVDVEGRSQAEVARALGVPLPTLRARVQRGRAALRALVATQCRIELDARGRVVACEARDGSACGCSDPEGACG